MLLRFRAQAEARRRGGFQHQAPGALRHILRSDETGHAGAMQGMAILVILKSQNSPIRRDNRDRRFGVKEEIPRRVELQNTLCAVARRDHAPNSVGHIPAIIGLRELLE